MSVVATAERPSSWRRAYEATGSTILALGVSFILALTGYALKEFTEQRTQLVTGAGVEAAAPQGWRTDATGTELVVRNPADPQTLMAASRVSSLPSDLGQLALDTTLERGLLLVGFQVTNQVPVLAAGRNGEQVEYSYITSAQTGIQPTLIDGVDMYLLDGSGVLVASYEAPREEFERDYELFERFLTSVRTAP